MERLTSHFNYCDFVECKFRNAELAKMNQCDFFNMTSIDKCHDRKIYEKLRELEDLEEQGRLIELPCAIGDTVYRISRYGSYIDTCGITGFAECDSIKSMTYTVYIDPDEEDGIPISDFGKTVFLTQEEAENALAEMG